MGLTEYDEKVLIVLAGDTTEHIIEGTSSTGMQFPRRFFVAEVFGETDPDPETPARVGLREESC